MIGQFRDVMKTRLQGEETVHTAPMREWMRQRYFSYATAFLLFLSVWGFSDNLFWKIDQPSNSDPKFIVHGSFCLAWMLLLFSQANLVRARKIALHRKLGVAGLFTAIGVTFSTAYVFWSVWRPWREMSYLVQANRLLLPGFSVLVLLAFLHRKRPDWHRRYILLASLYMLEPVLSRAFNPIEPLLARFTDSQIDAAWWVFFIVLWNALFLSLFAYDRVVLGRIHPATKRGSLLFYTIWVAVLLF